MKLVPLDELADQFRNARMGRGASFREVSAQTGIPASTLCQYEQNGRTPNLAYWVEVSNWINQNVIAAEAREEVRIEPSRGGALEGIRQALDGDESLTTAQRKALYEMMKVTYQHYRDLNLEVIG